MSHEKWYRVYGKCPVIIFPNGTAITKVIQLLEAGVGYVSNNDHYSRVNADSCLCQIDIDKTLQRFCRHYVQVENKYTIIGG